MMSEHEDYGFTTQRVEWCRARGIKSDWASVEKWLGERESEIERLQAQVQELESAPRIDMPLRTYCAQLEVRLQELEEALDTIKSVAEVYPQDKEILKVATQALQEGE